MGKKERTYTDLAKLRQLAENLIKMNPKKKGSQTIETETIKLFHELEVYQVELEMQNEELTLAKALAEELAGEKYAELYDFAPAGFFTLTKAGYIIELNLSGSQMLGMERDRLINSRIDFFVTNDTKPLFNRFLRNVFIGKTKESCEVTLAVNSNIPIHVFLNGIISKNGEQCMVTAVDITSRKQNEDALRESKEYYRLLFENSGEAILFGEPDGRIYSANPEACRILGRSEDEIKKIGREGIMDLSDPRLNMALEERRITGKFTGELNFLRKDGTNFPAELSTTRFKDSWGNERTSIFARDITERKKIEKALKDNNLRLELAMQAASMAWWELNVNTGNVTFDNRKAEMLGYPPEMFKHYKDFTFLLHPDDYDKAMNAMKGHLDGLFEKYELEYRILTKSGDYRWFYDVGSIAKNELNGKPQVVNGLVIDITERKQAEEKLKEAEKSRIAILQTAIDGYWLLDTNGQLLEVNETYCRMSGYSAQELRTMRVSDLEVAENESETLSHIQKVISQGEDRFESRHHRKDGSIYDVAVSVQFQPVEGGQFITFLHDITKRKQAEEALNVLNKELEDRIRARTAELLESNTSLRQTEEKYRTVADFTYDWEYWINNDGSFNYVSPSCERITGYTADEFINDPELLNNIVFYADAELWENHKKNKLFPKPEGIDPDLNFRIVTKAGIVRWICCVFRKIYLEGKYIGIRASNRDITDKITAENELLNITIEVEERERNRFSRELHDGLGPLLSTVKLYFQWLAETDDPDKIKIITEKGNNNIELAIQTTREVALGLSSLVLENSGYIETVLNFAQTINDTKKMTIDFTFNSRDRFGHFLEITLYRITTELINNTLKYARATNVDIIFNYNKVKKIVKFTYTDNGIGFDLMNIEKNSKGLGLLNIQQRIKILKGIMQIKTSIGKGIKVQIELPNIEPFVSLNQKNN